MRKDFDYILHVKKLSLSEVELLEKVGLSFEPTPI